MCVCVCVFFFRITWSVIFQVILRHTHVLPVFFFKGYLTIHTVDSIPASRRQNHSKRGGILTQDTRRGGVVQAGPRGNKKQVFGTIHSSPTVYGIGYKDSLNMGKYTIHGKIKLWAKRPYNLENALQKVNFRSLVIYHIFRLKSEGWQSVLPCAMKQYALFEVSSTLGRKVYLSSQISRETGSLLYFSFGKL